MSKQNYYYRGNKLYNVKKLKWSYIGKEIVANWKDKDDNNKEKLGEFTLKELDIK